MTNTSTKPTRTAPKPSDDTPQEQSLDETIESSFPASDPPSTIPAPEPDLERTGSRDVHDAEPTTGEGEPQ